MLPLVASLVSLALWLGAAITLSSGLRRIESLEDMPPAVDADCPPLSVIVPACNEAATIEPALCSLLALDYPDLELIVVDDRSTDGTGAISGRLAADDPRLRLLRVDALPPGWLGKNHALQVGSQAARGEWLLFTDADVLFRPDTLRRVMTWRARTTADHIVAVPLIVAKGFWERLLVTFFGIMFNLHARPWLVAKPGSPAYIGIGAFNMVRAASYRAFGGHTALPLEVADDMKLGKLMKRHGGRTGVIHAFDGVSVRWVVGLRGMVDGLTKNMFAGMEFRLGLVVLTVALFLVGHVYPPFGLLAGGPAAMLCGLALVCMVLAAAAVAPATRVSPLYGLAFPLAALIMLYIVLRSTWLTYRRGGVLWRGTLYPLEELRRGVV